MTRPLLIAFIVGCGGFVGSVSRYGLSVASQRVSVEWPLGTLTANAFGCLAIGIIAAVSADSEILSPELRIALATGFCGGFTTMSSMIYETNEMLRSGEYLHAAGYAAGTVVLSMAAFAAGMILVRVLFKMGG